MAAGNNPARTVKRRGILAAAGAALAGIAAKQAAQPVRATTTDTNFVASGGGLSAFSTDAGSAYSIGVSVSGSSAGVLASSTGGIGVDGLSTGNHAIFGDLFAPAGSGKAGVFGNSNGSGNFGLLGDGNGGGSGTGAVGVQGQNAQVGVVGLVNNAANTIAVYGNNLSIGANGIGVYGSCANGTGIYGQTAASYQYGVLGTTYAANSTAIAGTCTGNGSSAFSGGTTNPNAFAGVFQGTVVVQGKLVVSDPSYKSGALKHPDGSHRLVYCIESPESWIEDVGTGTLASGKATITLDKDFAAVVHTDSYHVFLTSYDAANKGLAVTNRTETGFVVQEQNGGTSSGTFSWKVMVKAKSGVQAERLEKFVMPHVPLPDPTKYKAPETPTAATPPKKP